MGVSNLPSPSCNDSQCALILLMKLVVAIIKPHKIDDVRNALNESGFNGMTISNVEGFGRQKGRTEIYRGAEYYYDWVPKIKIEIAVKDELLEEVIEIIIKNARASKIGDGKIFVSSLESAYRVRTGESGDDAL